MLTETDEIADALRDAARRWPEDRERPAKLLLDLVREGHRAIITDADRAIAERLAAIDRTAGALTGVYPPGYLERLRDDWPA
jgi:antitoxin (DNA-binding transcriptional repressor) of toxin-antitoxin stability system